MKMFKYELVGGENTLMVPGGGAFCHVGAVAGRVYLWTGATDEPEKPLKVYLAGTGEELPKTCEEHLGTALLNGGAVVVHAFRME